MADKTSKRKAFDIPVLDDVDEVVQVTPVFTRRNKTRNPKESKTTVSETETVKNTEKTAVKTGDQNDKNPTHCQEKAHANKTLCLDKDIIQTETSNKGESSKTNTSEKTVGNNFKETFAFIENTKHYEAPKASTSKSAESASSNQGLITTSKPNAVIVNQRQKGNPVLKFFRNVPWEYGDVIPDYVMGQRICALFLSVRYHNFNPDYIHERLKQLGNRYEVRILLVQVDVKDPHKTLKELTKIAILADCTLMLAWSPEETARYIEMYKIYENKPPDALQGQTSTDYLSKLTDCLTSVKSVNKTDTVTLLSTFESLENIISASQDDIALCPGFGPQKLIPAHFSLTYLELCCKLCKLVPSSNVRSEIQKQAKRLHEAFHQPFIMSKKKLDENVDKKSKS